MLDEIGGWYEIDLEKVTWPIFGKKNNLIELFGAAAKSPDKCKEA